jgi:hypothetical protein
VTQHHPIWVIQGPLGLVYRDRIRRPSTAPPCLGARIGTELRLFEALGTVPATRMESTGEAENATLLTTPTTLQPRAVSRHHTV